MSGHRGFQSLARRVAASACAVTVVTAAFVGMTATSASAAPAGSISGTVTAAAGGAPMAGICVGAFLHGPDETLLGNAVATAADGTYTIPNLPVGNVDVEFYGSGLCTGGGVVTNVVNQWYNNQLTPGTATPVAVADSVTTANVNAAMVAGGTITGSVTASVGGAPLNGICVNAMIPGTDETARREHRDGCERHVHAHRRSRRRRARRVLLLGFLPRRRGVELRRAVVQQPADPR